MISFGERCYMASETIGAVICWPVADLLPMYLFNYRFMMGINFVAENNNTV